MPRARALFLLGLILVNQAACYSWKAPTVTPEAYAAEHPGQAFRIIPINEYGDPDFAAGVLLRDVRFSGDSLFGRDPKGRPVALNRQHVAAMDVRSLDGARTGAAVVGGAILMAGALYTVTYLMGCALFPSGSLGGTSC
jgi:hypothetical protein